MLARALCLLLLWSAQALAFPTTAHYWNATEPEELAPRSYEHFDAESSSDFITYQRPLAWDGRWWQSARAFDLTIGSISSKQFLTYQRLKLYHRLSEGVEFRLHWLEERDFEQDRSVIPLELKFDLGSRFAVSVFGQPSLYKDEDDVGLSLFYFPSAEWELRLSGVWGDFQRNQRNIEADRWRQAPVGYTLSAMHLPAGSDVDFVRAEAHYEPQSIRALRGSDLQTLQYHSVNFTGLRSGFGWRALYDFAYNGDHVAGENLARKRTLNQIEYSFRMGPHIVRPGLNAFYRESRVGFDQTVTREVLPTVWFELPPRAREWGTRKFSLGYDATVFQQVHGGDVDRNLEHRLNTRLDFSFLRGGELGLLFTFDLDRFGSGETWEGGSGQFRLEF